MSNICFIICELTLDISTCTFPMIGRQHPDQWPQRTKYNAVCVLATDVLFVTTPYLILWIDKMLAYRQIVPQLRGKTRTNYDDRKGEVNFQ